MALIQLLWLLLLLTIAAPDTTTESSTTSATTITSTEPIKSSTISISTTTAAPSTTTTSPTTTATDTAGTESTTSSTGSTSTITAASITTTGSSTTSATTITSTEAITSSTASTSASTAAPSTTTKSPTTTATDTAGTESTTSSTGPTSKTTAAPNTTTESSTTSATTITSPEPITSPTVSSSTTTAASSTTTNSLTNTATTTMPTDPTASPIVSTSTTTAASSTTQASPTTQATATSSINPSTSSTESSPATTSESTASPTTTSTTTTTTTTTPQPTSETPTYPPGREEPDLAGKYMNVSSSMKWTNGWDEELNDKSSTLFIATKTSIENEIAAAANNAAGFKQADVLGFKQDDQTTYYELQGEQNTAGSFIADFITSYGIKECVENPGEVSDSMIAILQDLRVMKLTVNGTAAKVDEAYFNDTTSGLFAKAAAEIKDDAAREKRICDASVCHMTTECMLNNKTIECYNKCLPKDGKPKCMTDYENFPGSEGLALCSVNQGEDGNYRPVCSCKPESYNTGSLCLNMWWIVGPTIGGAVLLILIFSIVIAVVSKKRKSAANNLYSDDTPMDDFSLDDETTQKFYRDDTKAEPSRSSEAEPKVSRESVASSEYRPDGPRHRHSGPHDHQRRDEDVRYDNASPRSKEAYENPAYDGYESDQDNQDNYYTQLYEEYRDFTPNLEAVDTKPFKMQRPSTLQPPANSVYARADRNRNRDDRDNRPAARF